MAGVVPGIDAYEIAHTTLYKVHQRVAKNFRRGRCFLAGDAAHLNNPLGGMGMNGGIHDAINLTARLAAVWNGAAAAAELDRYEKQRRGVTLEYIETQSIANKRNLECANPDFAAKLRQHRGRSAAHARLSSACGDDRKSASRRRARLGGSIPASETAPRGNPQRNAACGRAADNPGADWDPGSTVRR